MPGSFATDVDFGVSPNSDTLSLSATPTYYFVAKYTDCSSLNESVQSTCNNYINSGGDTLTASGVYYDTLSNSSSCDSLIIIDLKINNSFSTFTQTECDLFISPTGKGWSTTGIYYDTISNHLGCDSIMTFDLTINQSSTGVDELTSCDSYSWIDGNTYTSNNNTATHTLMNAAGCDSIITLNLTINQSTTSTDVQETCDSYTWIDGNTYTSNNNTATYVLTNAASCDSIITLDLTINSSISETIDTTILEGESVMLSGNNYDSAGTYVDSLLTVQNCDSVVTINVNVTPNNIHVELSSELNIYPNPNHGDFVIEFLDNLIGNQIKVINMLGVEIEEFTIENNVQNIHLDVPNGVYFFLINQKTNRVVVN